MYTCDNLFEDYLHDYKPLTVAEFKDLGLQISITLIRQLF